MKLLEKYHALKSKLDTLEEQIQANEFSRAHKKFIRNHIELKCTRCINTRKMFDTIRASEIVPNKLWLKDETWQFILEELQKRNATIIRKPLECQGEVEFIIFELYC